MRKLAGEGADVSRATFELTTEDVRNACDVMLPVHQAEPKDGRVSIEVDPFLAHDTEGTVKSARDLWAAVDRPNVLIKIPATDAGLPAIRRATADGISVNVTLIFGIDRYRKVMDAYLAGLEDAKEAGKDLSTIHSVASFFVSRVDTEVDKRLDKIGTDEADAVRGEAAVANARLAYAAFEEVFGSDRFAALRDAGANAQRPLWASTGVKDERYPDTKYVTDLVVADTVNTMPEKTLEAFADHGELEGDRVIDRVTGRAADAEQVFDRLREVGIDFDDVLDGARARGRGEVREVLAGARRHHRGAAREGPFVTDDDRVASRASRAPPGTPSPVTRWTPTAPTTSCSSATATRRPSPPRSSSWSPTGSPAGWPRRTTRSGARPPRTSRPSGSAGSTSPGPRSRWSPRSRRCARSSTARA